MTSELSKQRTKGLPSRMGSTGGEGCWMICPPDPLMTLGQRFHKNNSVGNRRECDVIDGVGITPPSPRPAGLAAAGDLKAGAPRPLSTNGAQRGALPAVSSLRLDVCNSPSEADRRLWQSNDWQLRPFEGLSSTMTADASGRGYFDPMHQLDGITIADGIEAGSTITRHSRRRE